MDPDALAGTPDGVDFGFTQCPDVCPATMAELTLALARLPGAPGTRGSPSSPSPPSATRRP
ncbi:SCO family protein [Methylobacterium crusticola]|uniref:SCO family protein n=1 Tax=Methylobacterium crusticola TaxID=1697972 RepID=UPI000FFB1682